MGMFDEVLCNNELFGGHRGEVHQTKSLDCMGGASDHYEITPAGRLKFLEYALTEDHSDPNAEGWERLRGIATMEFTGVRKDMNYQGWLELSRFGRAKFTDGVMVAFEPEAVSDIGQPNDEATRSSQVVMEQCKEALRELTALDEELGLTADADRVIRHSIEIYGDHAKEWMERPLKLLNDKSPREVLSEPGGADRVDSLLTRIDDGAV
jgi:hypothetical protein